MVKNAIKVYARLKPEKDKKNILVSISCEYRIEVLSSFLFFQGLRDLVPSQEESGGRFLDSRLPHTKMQGLPWQSARIVEFLVRYHYMYISSSQTYETLKRCWNFQFLPNIRGILHARRDLRKCGTTGNRKVKKRNVISFDRLKIPPLI